MTYLQFLLAKHKLKQQEKDLKTGLITAYPTVASRLYEKNHTKDFTFSGEADLKALFL